MLARRLANFTFRSPGESRCQKPSASRDVRGFERQRVDPVLGGDFARNLLGGVGIGIGVVVQRIVQVEEDDIDVGAVIAG